MIVVDASAVLELLLQSPKAARIEGIALGSDRRMHAPHLLDVEVAQGLRRLLLARALTNQRAEQALEDFWNLAIERHAHQDLVSRAWRLKESLTAYDGVYIALAEALGVELLTCDAKLAKAHGHKARISLV